MNTGTLFSSKSDEWATPQTFFDRLNRVFHFDLDVCATPDNAKCAVFFTPETDGLAQPWTGHRCWMNPPYGREIRRWVQKADEEAEKGCLVVGLLPARTDTAWWHEHVVHRADVHFLRGRLRFGTASESAPFPSAVAIWHGIY